MAAMKAVRGVGAAWVLAACMVGCGGLVGSGNVVEESRETADFTALSVSDGMEAQVVVGGAKEVTLEGDDNLVEAVRTEVRDGTLSVWIPDPVSWWSPHTLVVRVSVPELHEVKRSGGARLEVSGLDTDAFRCTASGGGEVTLSGRATELTLETSGGTSTHAGELVTARAEVTMSGGGETRVQVSDTLGVTLSGGAHLIVVGEPTVTARELSGGSHITHE